MTEDAPYSLLKGLGEYSENDLPPVNDWHPDVCRDIDIRIDRAGNWFHEGSQIQRERMVRLFSTVLRKEDSSYYLVTPVEKCRIEVEDAPFIAVLMDVKGAGREQSLHFTTNVGDRITLDKNHPLRFEIDPTSGEPSPYIRVRDSLDALLNRNVYYQLSDLLEVDDTSTMVGVWSEGSFTALAKSTAVF